MSRVLLVDDDDAARLTFGALLEEEGFEVVEAASFDDAQALVTNEGEAFAVVILDVRLGQRNGLELVPMVRGRWPQARVLALSGAVVPQGSVDLDGTLLKGDAFATQLSLIAASE